MMKPSQQRVVGEPLDRIDGPKKVTGTATYAYEYSPDDVTYAFPVQSTIAKGRIASIDTSAAQAIPGVITVLTHENAPRLKRREGRTGGVAIQCGRLSWAVCGRWWSPKR